MKAMVVPQFGGPDVFEMREVETPSPGPNEVLVKVHASSINNADAGVRSGMFGGMMSAPVILGLDVSGVIEEVGPGVGNFQPGDEVYYAIDLMAAGSMRGGGNAEYDVQSADRVARKPRSLSFAEAAAVPVAGGTAWAGLITEADLRLGDSVLIHGAAGGVGSYAVQIAKAAGALVFATCGGYDADLVRSLGADHVIDYRTGDFIDIVKQGTNGRGVDVVLDAAGGQAAKSLPAVRHNGQVVVVAGLGEGDLMMAMRNNITIHFTHLEEARAKLERMAPLFDRGQLRSVIDKTFPLDQLSKAHAHFEQGGDATYGKIVVEVA